IRWPEEIPALETEALLNTVDIMPTLLNLVDINVPDTVEGTDLSSLIKGKVDQGPNEALISAFPGRAVAIKEFQEANQDNLEAGWRALRTNRYTYVIHKGYAPGEPMKTLLYDLDKDPFQIKPKLMSDPSKDAIARDLHKRLLQWLEDLGDPFHKLCSRQLT